MPSQSPAGNVTVIGSVWFFAEDGGDADGYQAWLTRPEPSRIGTTGPAAQNVTLAGFTAHPNHTQSRTQDGDRDEPMRALPCL